MANDYPNGWKDGYSSADHATQSYSPYAAERAQRDAMYSSSERDRRMSEYQEGLEREKRYREKIAAERARQDWIMEQKINKAREQSEQRSEAVKLIVQQKKDEYNRKSWFSKAIATLQGKSYDKRKNEILEAAERRVDRMLPEQVEAFIENQKEGRSR